MIFQRYHFNVFLMTLAFYLIFLWKLIYMFGLILLSSLQYFISLERLVTWSRAFCSLWVHLVFIVIHRNTIYGGWGLAPIYYSVKLISYFLDNFLQLSSMADPVPIKIDPKKCTQINCCTWLGSERGRQTPRSSMVSCKNKVPSACWAVVLLGSLSGGGGANLPITGFSETTSNTGRVCALVVCHSRIWLSLCSVQYSYAFL